MSFLLFLFAVALVWAFVFPIIKILQRMGLSGWWALAALVSFFWIPALWLLAYNKWPAVDGAETPRQDQAPAPVA